MITSIILILILFLSFGLICFEFFFGMYYYSNELKNIDKKKIRFYTEQAKFNYDMFLKTKNNYYKNKTLELIDKVKNQINLYDVRFISPIDLNNIKNNLNQ